MEPGARQFRFGVVGESIRSADQLVAAARRAEELGYSTLLLRDLEPSWVLLTGLTRDPGIGAFRGGRPHVDASCWPAGRAQTSASALPMFHSASRSIQSRFGKSVSAMRSGPSISDSTCAYR